MADQRIAVAGLGLLLGALILWLAVPRVVASALLAMRDPVILQMDAGAEVPKGDLLGLIASRELALRWAEERESHDERGTALARLAFREEPESPAQRSTLAHAISAVRAGLAAAPADPEDWMQLGYLLVLREGDPHREAAEALLLSIRTGAFQPPDFLLRRLFWALAHWTFYDPDEQERIAGQIRMAWRAAPEDVAGLAAHVPAFVAPIGSALKRVPGARQRLGAALAAATAATGR